VTPADYANVQLEEEKGEYVDRIGQSARSATIPKKAVEAMVDGFVAAKVREAIYAMSRESLYAFLSEQKELFLRDPAHRQPGNTSIGFHYFLLANKDGFAREMAERLKSLERFPKDKMEILDRIAFSENGLIAKFFDRLENRSIPMAKAATIAKSTINNVLAGLQASGKPANADLARHIKGLIRDAIMGDPTARKVFLDKPLADKIDAKIDTMLHGQHGRYSGKPEQETLGAAGNFLQALADMTQNQPAREGLNTAKNDKRNRRTPDR